MKLYHYMGKGIRIIFTITICLILYLVFRYQNDFRDNRALIGSAEIGMVSFFCFFILILVHIFIRKKKIYLKYNLDRTIVWMTVGIFIISIYIFCNIYFRTGWDVWTIDYAANCLIGKAEYIDWLNWYFGRYPNNILLTYIFAVTLKINELFGIFDTENGWMVFICLNCLAACTSALLVYNCVKKLCNRWLAVIGWGCCILLISLSPWTTIPYSDALTVGIPVLIFWIYVKIRNGGNRILWMAISFLGIIGGHLKPQTLIVLIAILVCELISLKKEKLKEFLIIVSFCILGTITAQYFYHVLYNNFAEQIPFNNESEVSWQYFFMMGLNDNSNGMWNEEDVNFSESIESKEERGKRCLKQAGVRLKKLGVKNYTALVNRKLCICFSDGTFSWSRYLGDFYAEVYEEKNRFSAPFFRNLYYFNGSNYPLNSTIRQICWCSILILIFFAVFYEKNKSQIVLMLIFVGCAVFEVIFEATTRHLYCNIPLFIILAMIGLHNMEKFFLRNVITFLNKNKS